MSVMLATWEAQIGGLQSEAEAGPGQKHKYYLKKQQKQKGMQLGSSGRALAKQL
jgi:hypothetical protein